MAHQKNLRKLGRQRNHFRALMRNMALALVEREQIETTETKAKEVRRFVDKLITLGKAGGVHNRRRAASIWGNMKVQHRAGMPAEKRFDPVSKVFGELADRYQSRPGGYTRIIKLGFRPGDKAPLVRLELVDAKPNLKKAEAGDEAEAKDENKETKAASATAKKATKKKKTTKKKKKTSTKKEGDE